MLRARFSRGPAIGLVLALALAACGGTGASTEPIEPVETDDVPIVTPAATTIDEATPPPDANGGSTDNGNGWPVTVDVVISGQDYFGSGGSYSATALARVCGNFLASMDPTGTSFTFEFPLDGEHNPRDIAFSADDLLPGATTSTFSVAVNVENSEGREPPAVRSRPGEENSNDTGTATVTEADGIRTLVVDTTNDFGTTIQLTAVCGPAPG